MTNLQKKALKRSHDLVNEVVVELFDLEKRKTKNVLKVNYEELQEIKQKLIEVENWLGALTNEKYGDKEMKRLIWTREQPTEPGWYWKRRVGKYKKRWGERDDIVYIRDYCGNLCIENWPIPDKDIEWAGPILKPKNPKKEERNAHKTNER